MSQRNPNRGTTKHHLLFPAAEWMLRPEASYLRQQSSLIPRIRNEGHVYLHSVVPLVPMLGYRTLTAAMHLWTPEEDTMRDIDGLCLAIGKAATHQKSHQIEKDLAGLTIEALQMEKAVLQDIGVISGLSLPQLSA